MKKLHFVIITLSLFTIKTSAQQLLNGSMEPMPGTTITTCSDIPKAGYNTNMGNVWEIGGNPTIYIANNSCGLGAPADGNSFTVMKYRVPLGNLLTFKLSGNLVINQPYKIAFKYKTIAGATTLGGLRCGYCKDSMSFDSTIGIINGMVNTAWEADTFSFTPKKAWHFMWFEIITLQGEPYDLHIDDLKLLTVPAGISDVEQGNHAIHIFPNPFHNTATISFDKNVQLPCRIELLDITGKLILQREVNDSQTTIDKSMLTPGMYFVRLIDKELKIYSAKLFAE